MFPTLFRVGEFRLATYGVLVAAGYLLGIHWLSRRRDRMGLSEDDFWSLVYWLFGGALLGGKLLYLAVEWRALAAGDLHPVRDIRYGFVFFGGVLGSMLAGTLWCRRRGLSFARLADYFAVALPMGHAVGRLGCLMAGCCAGRPTDLPWGVRLDGPDSLVSPFLAGRTLHPVQVYESLADLGLAWAASRMLGRVAAGRAREGSGFALYLGAYAAARAVLETFRGDDRGQAVFGLSPAQAIGLAVMAGAAVWAWRGRKA